MLAYFQRAPQARVFAAFFVYSLGLGGLYPRLGDIQLAMGVEEGALGLALAGAALGTQVSLMLSGGLIERIGYTRSLAIGIPMLATGIAFATLATGPLMLFGILFVAGLAVGLVEIIINVEADRTEHLIGKRVMNRAHAFWSFGFFAAGLVGTFAKGLGLDARVHLFGMAVLVLIATLLIVRDFAPAPKRSVEEAKGPRFVMPSGPILLLVGFTLSAMLLEGAGADWSVIYMRDVFETAPWINTLAFTIGALAQALMRFFADGFVDRYGAPRVARILVSILGIGCLMVTFAPHPAIALTGFGLMGIGTSAIFPLAMSAAAQRTDRPSAVNVAALAQLSFVTFLLAPPMLGFVAEHFSLRHAFGVGLPLIVLSFLTLFVLNPNRATPVSTGKNG